MEIQNAKRALSMGLSMLLVASSMNLSIISRAKDANTARIVDFSALGDEVAVQELPVGASLEDVNLPDTLKATVETVEEVEVKKAVEKQAEEPIVEPEEIVEEEPIQESVEDTDAIDSEDTMAEDVADEQPTELKEESEDETKAEDEDSVEQEEATELDASAEEPIAEETPTVETSEPAEEPQSTEEFVDTGLIDILFPAMVAKAAELDEDNSSPVAGAIEAAIPETEYETVIEEQRFHSEITIENVEWQIVGGEEFDSSKEASFVFEPVFEADYVVDATIPTIKVNIVNADLKVAFEKSQVVDGVRITVKADAGVFPEGAELFVEKVYGADLQAVEAAVEEERANEKNKVESYTFDIKVIDKDGNEIEPDNSKGQVKVSFTLEEVADVNLETDVYHVKGEVGDLSVDKLDATEIAETTVEAVTDGFSFYTVEFTYNNLQYVMNGNTKIALTEILDTVGLVGEVTSAVSDAPELFSVAQEDSIWYLTSYKAFKTEQKLTVVVDGVEYVIVVTDDVSFVEVSTFDELKTNLDAGNSVKLMADITIPGNGNNITIRGKTLIIDGNGKKIIGGEGNNTTISLTKDTNATPWTSCKVIIMDLTFEGLKTNNNQGGAINNQDSGDIVVLERCKFVNNTDNGPNNGGAGAIYNNGKLYVIDCEFTGNKATNTNNGQAGAIYGGGKIYVSGCTFTNNTSGRDNKYYCSGAIFVNNSEWQIVNCTFSGNTFNGGSSDISYITQGNATHIIAGCGNANIVKPASATFTIYDSATVEYSRDDALENVVFNVTLPQAAPTVDQAKTALQINYASETISPQAGYEVSSSNQSYIQVASSITSIVDSASPALYVRKAATDTLGVSPWTEVVLSRPAAPNGLTTTNASAQSVKDGAIVGTTTDMEYKASNASASAYTTASEGETKESPGEYNVRYKATENSFASKVITVTINSKASTKQAQNPPSVSMFSITHDSDGQSNGAINGVTTAMEYSTDGGNTWIKINGDSISGLAAGTYKIRYSETQDKYASEAVEVVIQGAEKATGNITVGVNAENPNDNRSVTITVEKGNTKVTEKNIGALTVNGLSHEFSGLPIGNYNVICTTDDGKYVETKLLSVEKDKTTNVTFKVLPGEIKTKVEVVGDAPELAVDGLGDLLTEEEKAAAASGEQSVEVTLTAEKTDESVEGVSEIKEIMSSGQTLDTILDLSLTKIITDLNSGTQTTTDIGKANNKVLEIAIPYTVAAGKLLASIYRYHIPETGQVQTLALESLSSRLTAENFEDAKFFFDRLNNYIYMYASDFSTYAIAIEDEGNADSGSSSSGSSSSNVISYPKLIEVYRLFNKNSGTHFYTSNKEERDILLTEYANNGWTDEGIAWHSAPKSGKPVYRLFDAKNGGHVYTVDANERSAYIANGYTDEGIAWYASDKLGRKVYKLTNKKTGKILYTILKDEADILINNGFDCEEAGFFAY